MDTIIAVPADLRFAQRLRRHWRGADCALRRQTRFFWAALIVSLGPVAVSAQNRSLWFGQLTMADGLSQDLTYSIAQDTRGFLWIGTAQGLNRYDGYGFKVYRHDPDDPRSLSSDKARVVYVDRSGVLWIGTEQGGLNRFDATTETFTHYRHDPADARSLGADDVRAIHEDRGGGLWVGSREGGLSRLDRATGSFTHYRHDSANPDSLGSDDVLAILEDRAGVLWIGTNRGGLDRLDRLPGRPTSGRFTRYGPDPDNPVSISHNDVRALFEDREGVLWIGTNRRLGAVWLGTANGGLNRLDRTTGAFTRYRHDPADPRSLSSDDVRAIYEDRAGVLWIGTNNEGLNRFDRPASRRATGGFTRYRHGFHETSLANDDVEALYEDRTGTFWVGFDGGQLDVMDRSAETFRRSGVPADAEQNDRGDVKALFEEASGKLWIAFGEGGLLRLDRTTGVSVEYRHDAGDPKSLGSDEVRAIHQDEAGTLWVGTGAGLNRFDEATETFTHFKEEDGLPSDVVQAILEDERGSLWVSAYAGLSRFEPSTESFRSYPIAYLKRKALHPGAALKTRDGEMLIAGRNGMVAFFPAELEDPGDVPNPSLVFTSFKLVGEEARLETSITELEELALSHRDRLVSFEVAMLDLKAPQKYRYAYRLEGLQDDWLDLGQRREITFSNLDPGSYTLRVRGWSVDRRVPEEEIVLAIWVAPPFWATWWFRTLAAFAGLALLTLGYQVRARSIRMQAEISERKLVQAERETLIRQLEAQNAELERFAYTARRSARALPRRARGPSAGRGLAE